MILRLHNAPINVKPEGVGGCQVDVGDLNFIVFPTLRNLIKSLNPRLGTFEFLARTTEN